MAETQPLQNLLDALPQAGRVEWIGIRPSKNEPMIEPNSALLSPGTGLEGDHFSGAVKSSRQVTLIQYEHLQVIAACLHRESVAASLLRRNIVISGINLLALKGKHFRVGEAVLEFTGQCHPCSRMETLLGKGGFNAMRGHGGITSRVCVAGLVRLGADVTYLPDSGHAQDLITEIPGK